MQFHPTVLYVAGSSRHLITEAIRGEGHIPLIATATASCPNMMHGQNCVSASIVSRAIVAQMEKTRHPNVYLDLTHRSAADPLTVFPESALCAEFGLDITCDRIPVRPGGHYMSGGDRGLRRPHHRPASLAVGELASTGRMGGTGWPRTVSAKRRLRLAPGGRLRKKPPTATPACGVLPLRKSTREWSGEPLDIADIRNSLKSLMWRACGVRDGQALAEAAGERLGRCRYVLRQFSNPIGWELQNMLTLRPGHRGRITFELKPGAVTSAPTTPIKTTWLGTATFAFTATAPLPARQGLTVSRRAGWTPRTGRGRRAWTMCSLLNEP